MFGFRYRSDSALFVGAFSAVGAFRRSIDEWMDGIDEWMDGWMDGCMDGWMDRWMDAWMHGCMDGWVDGRINACMHALTKAGVSPGGSNGPVDPHPSPGHVRGEPLHSRFASGLAPRWGACASL